VYRVNAMKRLSQNFLLEPKLHNRIVNVAGNIGGCHVCEVGPGPGGITRAILQKKAASVVVIEKDRRFLPSLELLADAADNRLKIIVGDVMSANMENLFPKELARDWDDHPPDIHVIGNLPFNISTPLIIRWLRDMSNRKGVFAYGRVRLTLTFQKEVAQRMVAEICSKQRCRLSIMCQHLAYVKYNVTIKGSAFVPKPKVDVGVVHFIPRKQPLIQLPINTVEKFMRNVFHFRQKFCMRGVEVLFPPDVRHELTSEVFQVAEVEPTTKCYQLTMEELDRMTRAYHDICQRIPFVNDYDYRACKKTPDEEIESDAYDEI